MKKLKNSPSFNKDVTVVMLHPNISMLESLPNANTKFTNRQKLFIVISHYIDLCLQGDRYFIQ